MSEAFTLPRLGKAQLAALESLWKQEAQAAETGLLVPAALPRRTATELKALGLIEWGRFYTGVWRLGAMFVPGYSLTHAGRYLYGVLCGEEGDADE